MNTDIHSLNSVKEKTVFKEQLCQLKYKCAVSLMILVVLLFETIVRRLEEVFHNKPFPFAHCNNITI